VKRTPNFLNVPKGKNYGNSGLVNNDFARIPVSVFYPSPSVGSLTEISGGITEMGCGTTIYEPHISSTMQ
jgi:hypothetical protein